MSLKIGILGTGNIARGNYIPCLAAEEDVSLGYYTRTRAKAEAVAEEFGGEVFDSLASLVSWGPDSTLVLTGEMDRYDAATALLALGPRRVFFEKPLVARLGQANVSEGDFFDGKRLMQQAAKIGCETAMIFNYRFLDQSVWARRIIEERRFGKVTNITGLVHYACWSHCIDLIHFFAGQVAEVCALQSEQVRIGAGIEAQDVTAAFRTDGDATGTLIGTSGLQWDFPLFEMTFSFEGGRVGFRGLDGDMEVMDANGGRHEVFSIPRDRSRWDQYGASFKKSISCFK